MKQKGFTLIEMIIVVAIIGILLAILIPSLSGVKSHARKVKEISLMSHVVKAWAMYYGEHQGSLLQGYVSTGVQEYHEFAWAFPNESIVPPAPSYNDSLPNDAGPWTWRLLQYLDYDWRSLFSYRNIEPWENEPFEEHASTIATEPAFGYNGYYLGGWWEIDAHSHSPFVKFGSVLLIDNRRENVVSRTMSNIKKPTKQIVFCSTFFAIEGIHKQLENSTPGTFFANPSIVARATQWIPLPSGNIDARKDTYAPLGRSNGMPVISMADGSARSVELETLIDQSLWIPRATQVGNTPASEFTHTVD